MKAAEIFVKKLKEKGVADAEIVMVHAFEAIQESMPEIVIDPDTSSIEKTFAGILAPVLAGFKPSVEAFADFNKNGKVG